MTGRPPSCTCGTCEKCKRRIAARNRYQAMSMEERRAWVARRDREKMKAADRARYYRHHAKRKAKNRDYQQANPDIHALHTRRYVEKHPDHKRATTAVSNALRDGRLIREPCEVCGKQPAQAHHDDYSKPLDVRWLCQDHHGETWRKY